MEPEVVIVGGGAIGTSTAYELALRGARVTLLERGSSLAPGCSSGNAGLICPSHSLPLATPASLRQGLSALLQPDAPFALRPRPAGLPWLARFATACRAERADRSMLAIRRLSVASLELHAKLAPLGTSFERRGTVGVYETGDSLAAARREAEASGLRAQLLSAEEACALEPALRPGLAGAVYYPDDAHLDPLRYVQAIGEAAASAGAELRTGVEVRAIRRLGGGIAVETTDREFRPEAVVLAAGAWTGRLSRSLGVFVPLTGGKGYHIDFAATAGDPEVPVWIHEGRLVAAPAAGRIRVAGTLELGSFDLSINRRRIEAIRRAAGRALPGLWGRSGGETWAGLRPCTPDGLPVIGRSSREPSLILATGHAMKGVALAPVTARLVSEVVGGEASSLDLAPFSPDRFRPLLRSLAR